MSTISSAHSYMSPPRGDSVHEDLQSEPPQRSDIATPGPGNDPQEGHSSESESPIQRDPSARHRRFYSLNYAPSFLPPQLPQRNTFTAARKGYRSSVILNPIYEEETHGKDFRYEDEIYFSRPSGSHTYSRGFIIHHNEDDNRSRTVTPDYSRHSGMRPESRESFPYYSWSSRASSCRRPIVVPPVVITSPHGDHPWQPPHMPFFVQCPPPKPSNYMWFAVVVACFINVLFGLIAIHFSFVSKFEWRRGNAVSAKRNGLKSRNVALAGVLTTVIFLFIVLVCLAGFGILEFPDVILL